LTGRSAPDASADLRPKRRKENFGDRLSATRRLVGYTDDDARRVEATRKPVLAAADTLTAAVYKHLVSHDETAEYFTRADGRVDHAQIAERTASLKQWLAWSIEAPLDDTAAAKLADIGRAHTKRGGHTEKRVRARYLVSAMAYVEAALLPVLDGAIKDRQELLATVAAWIKLLTIQLDMFLAVYASGEGTAHWY
jgi:hypothetical protein